MSDLTRWLRVKAIEERVSVERQKTVIAEAKSGKIDGVSVDENRGRILVDCILEADGELVMASPVINPDFYRISTAQGERGPRIAVLADNRDVQPFLKETRSGQLEVFVFRNGIVFRCWKGQDGATVTADYVGVRRENGKVYLVIYPRFELGMPRFAAKEDLLKFLEVNHISEEFLGIVARLVGTNSDGQIINPKWVDGLDKAKASVTPAVGVDVPPAKADSTPPKTPSKKKGEKEKGWAGRKRKAAIGDPAEDIDTKQVVGRSAAEVQEMLKS